MALVRGQAWPDDFSPPAFEDVTIRRVMDRVEAVHDDALDRRYPRVWPSWVRVHLANGARHEMHVDHALGDPENFPSAAALETKFLRLGRRALDADRLARLVNSVTQTADAADVGAILMLCQSAT